MLQPVRRVSRFLTRMDATAATSLLVSVVLLAFVIFMLVYGQQWLNLEDAGQHERLIAAAARSPIAILGVIAIFAILALTGFPQILMIAATVTAFGPANGAAYAWIATMASATLTFAIGRYLGGGWVQRIGGSRSTALMEFLARRGVLASALIRVVPSAPFIVVNAAAGAAHIPFWKYGCGTAIGIVPKILFVAVIAAISPDAASMRDGVGGVLDFFTAREPARLALIAGAIAAWLLFLMGARAIYLRFRDQAGAGGDPDGPTR